MDDLIGGIAFTIKTDHRNLLYMNKHGFRKVLQWKLDMQHYDTIIEHVPGTLNIPADAFSRLVEKAEATVHHIIVLVSEVKPVQSKFIIKKWIADPWTRRHTYD